MMRIPEQMRWTRLGRVAAHQTGSVFLLAMTALIVLMLLGASLIQTSIQSLSYASKDKKKVEAVCLAESGVDMAINKLYEDYGGINAQLESSGTYHDGFQLEGGYVSYHVTAPYNGIADTCLIVSDSNTDAGNQARVRVVASYLRDVSRIFEGAIFSDSPLTLNGGGAVYADADGTGGDIYANGNITFNGTSFDMDPTGHIYTTGETNWFPSDVPSTHVHESIAPYSMPVIDLDYYQSIASYVYSGKKTFTTANLAGLSGVVYVNGDVKISGSYSGSILLVATGSISITGDVTADHPATDSLALLSAKSIKIAGNPTIHGLIYGHSVVTDVETTISGNTTIYGAVCSDVVRTNGGMVVHYRDVWKGLPLPGTGKTQWAPVSWQQLNVPASDG